MKKLHFLGLISFICFFMLTSVASAYSYADITISNNPGIENYQMYTDITYKSGMAGDFANIRLYDSNGNEIPYWIQTYSAYSSARIWYQIDAGTSEVQLRWDLDGEVTDESDGETVFDWFTDCSGSSLPADMTKVGASGTVSVTGGEMVVTGGDAPVRATTAFGNNYIFMSRMKTNRWNSTLGLQQAGWVDTKGDISEFNGIQANFAHTGSAYNCKFIQLSSPYLSSRAIDSAWSANTYYVVDIKRANDHAEFLVNGVSKASLSTVYYPTGNLYPYVRAYNSGDTVTVDWIAVRKYAATEPSSTVGSVGTANVLNKGVYITNGNYTQNYTFWQNAAQLEGGDGAIIDMVIGVAWAGDQCHYMFPGTTSGYYVYSETDEALPYIDNFTSDGKKIIFSIQPGKTDIPTVMNQILTRYAAYNESILGINVDLEWKNTPGGIKNKMNNTERDAALAVLKSHDSDYKLFVTYFETYDYFPSDHSSMVVLYDGEAATHDYILNNCYSPLATHFQTVGIYEGYASITPTRTYDLEDILAAAPNTKYIIDVQYNVEQSPDPGVVIPIAEFSVSTTSADVGQTLQFTDESIGIPTGWSWDFGDGNTSTSQNPTHAYASAGQYTVTLTTSNALGSDTEIKTNYITVHTPAPPTAAFIANRTSGILPLTVGFTDLSTGNPTSWVWSFGDDTESSLQNPVHTYTEAGVYTVVLTATDSDGSDAKVKVDYISVYDVNTPVAAFTVDNRFGVAPLTVSFTDTSLGTPASWSWDFGDGNTSTSQNPTHIYNAVGLYTVSLTITNEDGSDIETKASYINTYSEAYSGQPATLSPVAEVWAYIANGTSREYTFATDQAFGLAHWFINGNEVASTTGNNLSYTHTEPGYWNVSVFVENLNGNSTMLEFRTRVGRTMANEHVAPLDETNYNNLMSNVTNLSTDGIMTWAVSPFTDQVGRIFYLVLFCLPFLFIWMQTGKLTIVTALTLITGSLFIGFIPETFKTFIAIAIVLSFATAFYKLSRGP